MAARVHDAGSLASKLVDAGHNNMWRNHTRFM
jgi:hypothetical protein